MLQHVWARTTFVSVFVEFPSTWTEGHQSGETDDCSMRSCFSKRWINLGFFDYWPTNTWYIFPWVVIVHVFRPSLLLVCACLLSIQSYSGKRPCFQFNQLCMITAALCHQEASAGPTAPGLISSPCAPVGYHAPGMAKAEQKPPVPQVEVENTNGLRVYIHACDNSYRSFQFNLGWASLWSNEAG